MKQRKQRRQWYELRPMFGYQLKALIGEKWTDPRTEDIYHVYIRKGEPSVGGVELRYEWWLPNEAILDRAGL